MCKIATEYIKASVIDWLINNYPDVIIGNEIMYGTSRKMVDCFWRNYSEDKYSLAYMLLFDNNYESTLSYVWEEDRLNQLLNSIKERTYDTEELIIIRYSFPYVNREVDTKILNNMTNLKCILIQDPAYDDIQERVSSMLESAINIEHKRHSNLNQFYIPNHF